MNIVFFGSTDDSVIVLDALHKKFPVSAIITQPAKPIGRKQIITPTPVELWAKKHTIPVLTFPTDPEKQWRFMSDDDVANAISSFHPDLIITACFGERIPKTIIERATHGGINVHPSLLPRWRGAYPVPWAIIAGDTQTGVTVSTITEHFDDGRTLAQKKIPLTQKDMPDELRKKLFSIGATLLVETLPDYLSGKNKGIEQRKEDVTVARRLTRDDGFVEWNEFVNSVNAQSPVLERKLHAFFPWPGIWTTTPFHKRLKLISLRHAPIVQLEGKRPVDWITFQAAYFPKTTAPSGK